MNKQEQTPSFNNAPAAEEPKPWKQLEEPTPIHVVQMIPIDVTCRMLMLHRSHLVRSAKNMWSFPSGIHDIGETMFEACRRELKEEFNLEGGEMIQLGTYDNIIDEEFKFHWVISVFGVRVEDVHDAVNKEPDKHDIIRTEEHVSVLAEDSFFRRFNYHHSFEAWMKPRRHQVVSQLMKLSHYPPISPKPAA